MAIYNEEYQRQPNESFLDYLLRMNQLRASGMLGNYKTTPPTPTVGVSRGEAAPASGVLGQQTVMPMTDEQMRAIEQRDSGGSNIMPERDTPEQQQARRNAAMNKQIRVALGQDPVSNTELAGAAGMLGGPLFAAFGGAADLYERDVAALQLGMSAGAVSKEAAKDLGYALLDNPEILQSKIASGSIAGIDSSITQPRQRSMVERLFKDDVGDLLSDTVSSAGTAAPVYTSIAQAQRAAQPFNYDNYGGMFTGYSQTEEQKKATQKVAADNQDAAYEAMGGGYTTPSSSDSGSSPSGGGTPLSEIQGTTEYQDSMGYSSDTSGGWGGWGW